MPPPPAVPVVALNAAKRVPSADSRTRSRPSGSVAPPAMGGGGGEAVGS